ncbi:DUF3267 domain-containing protein [Quadrisphaera sp. GCM10027208]|uniref:DUF3267 domain-containing protein n=1 Tax=Quadrisphaera sp. GCM10027208 TaxID=3273423 RepID=UPI003606802F|nr:DUF3267 domain-containing protein [Kineosporiaceae bacterium SCSIO 59966]
MVTMPTDTHLPDTPPGYRLVSSLDLRADRRTAALIQGGFLVVAGVLVVSALALGVPLDTGWSTAVAAAVTVTACLGYMLVHELTHALALRLLTGVKPTVRVRLPYLATGSTALLTRRQAITVALAPVTLWGVVLPVLALFVPADFVLTVFVVVVLNLAGSSGDAVQAHAFTRLPPSARIRDDGATTCVFDRV